MAKPKKKAAKKTVKRKAINVFAEAAKSPAYKAKKKRIEVLQKEASKLYKELVKRIRAKIKK
jgi:hypothetical protein